MFGNTNARSVAHGRHYVLDSPMAPPFAGMELALFAMGCFWAPNASSGRLPGPLDAGRIRCGHHPNPTYDKSAQAARVTPSRPRRVRSGPDFVRRDAQVFWENHDPTQGMRQATTSARTYSRIYPSSAAQRRAAETRATSISDA